MIPKDDLLWLQSLLPRFGIPKLKVKTSESKAKWPDIWVTTGKLPVITVTSEWARQDVDERRARLLHEILHLIGLQHGRIGRWEYSTYPDKDSYSREVYRRL